MRRRDALRWMAMSTVAGAATRLPRWGDAEAFGQGRQSPPSSFVPDVELALRAAPGEARILSGAAMPVWRFTGQVIKGPADDEEAALNLPSGTEEIVCVLQERTFDARNQLTCVAGGMMDQMHGFLGDRMLVNGKERPSLALATRAYRLRLLNGSNARIYKLMWSDGTPMTIIGTDGGWLEQARARSPSSGGRTQIP